MCRLRYDHESRSKIFTKSDTRHLMSLNNDGVALILLKNIYKINFYCWRKLKIILSVSFSDAIMIHVVKTAAAESGHTHREQF